MEEQELLPRVRVNTVNAVREYCESDRLAYLYFDSIIPATSADDIEPADIWIANNLNGRIQLAEFAAIWERAERQRETIERTLSAIPSDACLWKAENCVLRGAGWLFDILCGPRAYGSRVSKILHKKRPDLVPIIDSRMRAMFEAVVPSVQSRSWSDYLVEIGRVIGPWIERNAAALDHARRPYPAVTRLRAYDICLWKHAAAEM